MSDELDPNVIAADFLKQNLDSLVDGARSVLKGAVDKLRLTLDRTYRDYLAALSEKYSKAKSFLLRGEPVPLYGFYVPLDLTHKKTTIAAAGIGDVLKRTSHAIITGSAGCGKSMFVRHLLLDCLLSKTRVPVFVELRHFNSFPGSLQDLIIKTLSSYHFSLGSEYVSKAIENGHFILFLDGYDEVAHEKRTHVRTTILEFAKRHDNTPIVVTSRQDPELEGWQLFTLFQVAPLSLAKAYSLVDKLPFDNTLKAKFLSDLRSDLFHKHESFLSNPLLLSIMLLSYGQSATIPNKISVFYNQAYEALFERHDVLKDGFCRQLLSPLDIQDFARLFSAFCIQAYDRGKLEFTHTEALEFIEASQAIVGIKCTKDDYLQDLIQAVCLMVQDGLQIVYAHRSFQEYFAARFICEARPEVQEQLLKKYASAVSRDSVFLILHEMRPEIIERFYVVPGLNHLFQRIGFKRTLGVSHHERLIRACFSSFLLTPEHLGATFERTNDWPLIELASFTLRRCGPLVGWRGFGQQDSEKALAIKWSARTNDRTIDIRKSPHGREFIRDLAKSGGFFSLDMLKALLAVRDALGEKAKIEEQSLAAILKK